MIANENGFYLSLLGIVLKKPLYSGIFSYPYTSSDTFIAKGCRASRQEKQVNADNASDLTVVKTISSRD